MKKILKYVVLIVISNTCVAGAFIDFTPTTPESKVMIDMFEAIECDTIGTTADDDMLYSKQFRKIRSNLCKQIVDDVNKIEKNNVKVIW